MCASMHSTRFLTDGTASTNFTQSGFGHTSEIISGMCSPDITLIAMLHNACPKDACNIPWCCLSWAPSSQTLAVPPLTDPLRKGSGGKHPSDLAELQQPHAFCMCIMVQNKWWTIIVLNQFSMWKHATHFVAKLLLLIHNQIFIVMAAWHNSEKAMSFTCACTWGCNGNAFSNKESFHDMAHKSITD
jgi:hypothetical protein